MRADLIGHVFERLTVLKFSRSHERSRASYWLCACSCGAQKEIKGASLANGSTRSCGCLKVDEDRKNKHGMCGTKTYTTWDSMIQRCGNPKNTSFKDYGGRGITVCERWHTFANFLADMGEKPDGMQIDRERNNEGYGPGNCRWATPLQNIRNKRNTRFISVGGREMCIAEAAEIFDIPWSRVATVSARGGYFDHYS